MDIHLTWREREREIRFDYQVHSMHSRYSFIHFDALIRIFSIQLSEKELRKKRLSVRYCRHVCCCVMLWLPGFVDIILLFFIILVTIVSFRGEGGAGFSSEKAHKIQWIYDIWLKCSTKNKRSFSIENGKKEVEKRYSL